MLKTVKYQNGQPGPTAVQRVENQFDIGSDTCENIQKDA